MQSALRRQYSEVQSRFIFRFDHVLALADDSATSQHLMPRASSSVTMPTERLRSLRNVVTIVGLSIREMADASPSKYS